MKSPSDTAAQKGSLIAAFHRPSSLDEMIESITQAPTYILAVSRVKEIARNQAGYGIEQIREVLEGAQAREVNAKGNAQRPAVRQALRNALKALPPEINAAAEPDVTDAQPRRNEWDAVRETINQITFAGRMFLRGQVKLGMLLAELKKSHGVSNGGDRKSAGRICQVIPWDKVVTDETGFSRRSGDEFIRLFEATKVKLKKTKTLKLPAGSTNAIALFESSNALALTEEQWTQVDELIGTLTTGETQASLMAEMGIIPKPKPMPKAPGSKEKDEQPTAGQMAFHFFSALADPLVSARCNPEYKKLLLALPVFTDSENSISLTSLEDEARAFLADIEDAKQAASKPAKGRVINS